MFGIGAGEFILIMIVGLIVFGPSKLPEIGRSVGKLLREFRKAQSALTATLSEVDEPAPAKKKPLETKQPAEPESAVKVESTTKTQSIEEVTKMINENPIKPLEPKVNLSKETVDK